MKAQGQRKIILVDLWVVVSTVPLRLNLLFWIANVKSSKSHADARLGSKEGQWRLMFQNFNLKVVISVLKTTFRDGRLVSLVSHQLIGVLSSLLAEKLCANSRD